MRHVAPSVAVGIASLWFRAAPLAAQKVPSIGPLPAGLTPSAAGERKVGPPLRLAEKSVIAKPALLRPASEGAKDELDALDAWNHSGKRPTRAGFSRPLPEPITARFQPNSTGIGEYEPQAARAVSPSGSLVWGTRVTVQGAYAVRLHLTNVHLPSGARLWTYGTEGQPSAFGTELLSSRGDLWTPAVFAETAYLEVEIPVGAIRSVGGFVISEVAEIVNPARLGSAIVEPQSVNSPTCLQDASCIGSATFAPIAQARKAVAQLHYMNGGKGYLCTGTLLNDTKSDFALYLLTAHHCLSNQDEVSTLEAFWDYFDTTCGGTAPSLGSLPRSNGGTLLAAGAISDFSFIKLFSIPAGRVLMGWDARPSSVGPGTKLYRVSHPAPNHVPLPQDYSETLVDPSSNVCIFDEVSTGPAARPEFIYSATSFGDIYGGSSGAAAMLADGSVVGQLLGTCPAVSDNCTQSHEISDGAFSQTYAFIAPWLNATTTTQPCMPNANTLCLNGGRFRVAATFRNQFVSGTATAIRLSDATGFFTFDNPASVELVVKVLNACSFTPNFWVFAGGLTNQETTLTVTDTKTGEIRPYFNPLGTTFVTVTDTAAFSTCP